MDELISKKAVIEAIERARANVGHNLERSIGKSIIEILDDVGEDVGKLPSALSTNLAEVGTDCISRQAAQTELQLSARRYTVAHEAHGEGQVVWSEDLISVSDAMNVLRKLPSAQPETAKRIVGKSRDGMTLWYQCDMCYEPVDEKDIFCRGCGRRFENG